MGRTRGNGAVPAATAALVILAGCGAPQEVYDPQPTQPPGSGRELQLDPDTVPEPGYVDLLLTAADTCPGIDAPTLAAQLAAESGWDPQAQSPAGAQGIAQFMPATWSAYGLDANGDGIADPFDPADAIASQGLFMCTLHEAIVVYESDGSLEPGRSVEFTLAAYNAGLGAVEQYRGIPPFAETQAYVPQIMAARLDYATGDDGGAPVEGYFPAGLDCAAQDDPMEAGLQPTTVRGLRCVREQFTWSTITSGWRERGSTPRSDHPAGLAIDAASAAHGWDTEAGRRQNWQMAHWFQVNADRLGVKYIIFHNYRWPAYDGAQVWVPYDHSSGSGPSLDHHDHVHVSFDSQNPTPDAPLINHAPRQGTHPRGIWVDPADALPPQEAP